MKLMSKLEDVIYDNSKVLQLKQSLKELFDKYDVDTIY